ncbi:AAA domain-containing protein [Phycicoccus sp. Soil803]|uniref:AAA domain-containing protein n=1 Tax=Phycicoccus sp. Soil803 TaxID=1736415 RepID=UPI000AD3A0ED|nr:AAA domain-containing protein [Phycicoccus sp. Soil803]
MTGIKTNEGYAMATDRTSEARATLHPLVTDLAEALARDAGSRAEIVRGDNQSWLAVEETSSTITFVEAEGTELRIVPFVGDSEAIRGRSFVNEIRPSWLDGERELVADVSALHSHADRGQVIDLMRAALDYWTKSADTPAPAAAAAPVVEEPIAAHETAEVDFSEEAIDAPADESTAEVVRTVEVRLRADISDQWSWASSAARIPQISDLTVAVVEPIEHARISVVVRDADVQFGTKLAFEGSLNAGTSVLGSVHVPLSARVMSQVEERRGAECVITLDDAGSGRVLARYDEELDIQPRDLWFWQGDPRRSDQRVRMERRFGELVGLVQEDPEHPDIADMLEELEALKHAINVREGRTSLGESLLASFVRPNHPEISAVSREAADFLGKATGDSSFHAFQIEDIAQAEERADATVAAIYEALQARSISYSEPPPGWDYTTAGQRIRDHGEVAKAGLGTCMDTTVLMAAVIEQVGLHPVLVFIPGHIFAGYWRRDPQLERRGSKPEWYPGTPVVSNPGMVMALVEGGWLGIIETTTFTAGNNVSAGDARSRARYENLARGLQAGFIGLVDVAAARREGVSPLPAINERTDGVTEIIEYRAGGAPAVTEVATDSLDAVLPERQVDSHPARYRTWKSSLFSLNATNSLLNLGSNARVQPLVLPREALGLLEDKLNQDVSFSLHSGYDVPEVWRARDIANALQLVESGETDDRRELVAQLGNRKIFVQRFGRVRGEFGPLGSATFAKEIRSMAHSAKTARDERGMNPLFLCIGLLRWPYKAGVFAEAPLILIPVNIAASRGRQEFTLSLDSSQQTTPNAALIEWLRREHGLTIPGLAEPLADRAGIDVDGVLAEVRKAVADRGLPFDVAAEARLATLDLSAFRMWQDLNVNADHFFERPLVKHLVHTPTETFEDPAIEAAGDAAHDDAFDDELERLEAPIPADSTQKRAVLWARQGRTFVLQGPPGTGKSQTITNIVAECLLTGLRVLFVAEKGTALAVVQRRLDAIGLGPFTLNLHHEGSNAGEVRAQLKRSLTATVIPDNLAMESARRQLRNARFELTQYPQQLHKPNAAGLSAYSAHDELLVLQDGPSMPIPTTLVAHNAEQIGALKSLFENLQRWTAAAGVRPDHPWRLAGVGEGDPFDLERVSGAVRGILTGVSWSASHTGALREALDSVTRPAQLNTLAAAANPTFPSGDELVGVLDSSWPARSAETLAACERAVEGWTRKLSGFAPDVLGLDLRSVAQQFDAATGSGFMGRKGRQTAAIAPLAAVAPAGMDLNPANARALLADLVAAMDAGEQVRTAIAATPGLSGTVPTNAFMPGALAAARVAVEELTHATASLRDGGEWTQRVNDLAVAGHLAGQSEALVAYAAAWSDLWTELAIQVADFEAWRNDATLISAVGRVEETWRRDVDHERLVPLQRWCTLVRKLEPMRSAGLDQARVEILEGALPAYTAEDALARGVARASLAERITTEGLDRFDAVAHDQRVSSYSESQTQVRNQWVTDGPARIMARRGGGGLGSRTGGLARELEKTTRKLGTRPILRKYGEAVQELTPLVLCSPSSVVDLIEPGVMEFDLVIFDEASQITVPEAVGALGRARAAIVVGDSKQMPPTRKVGGGSVDDDEIDDPDAEEILEDQESILSECELARVPTLSLNWHYRSQDEALIAFSNRTYYRGDLSSFPTPTLLSSETGLEFRPVRWTENGDKGMYLRAGAPKVDLGNGIVAGSNTNPFEAAEIVKYVRDLVHAAPTLPSVGIVTFNEQQRQLIEDLLLADGDPKVADVLDESKMGRGEALFVKALEQVQGDERDIVIFSIAFSKQANGKVPTNFGPLSNAGGERRLNVAVTRARRKNVVFCSFNPASNELDVTGSTYQGPKDLKQFLMDAQAAGSQGNGAEIAHRIAIRDRHRDDIAAALRDAGLHVMSDVGMSNFRLDLVLARPENPQRPILPVLLDGESWMKRNTVSDRDVLPVEVLENLMGWPTVARIWWPMWLQNREEVLARILAEVDRAEIALKGGVAKPGQDGPPEAISASEAATLGPEGQDRSLMVAATSGAKSFESELEVVPSPVDVAAPQPSVESPSALEPPLEQAQGTATASVAPPVESESPVRASERDQRPSGGSHSAADDAGSISEFVAAHANVVGARLVLDALPDRAAAAIVGEQLLDVIEAEGPIELARLTRIVARRFGLNAVRAARADDIARLVPRAQLRKGRLGSFAWPANLDPATWTGIRYVDADATRSLDEVAPEEIANAMLAVRAEYPGASGEDILRRTAEFFGILRLGANVRSRLDAVYKMLPSDAPAALATAPVAEPPGRHVPAPAADTGPERATPQQPHVGPISTPTPEVPVARPPDPVVQQLAREAETIRPDLGRVEAYLYYDYARDRELGRDLKSLVDQLVLDPDYDGRNPSPVADARTAHLSAEDAESVGYAARMVWRETVGKALDRVTKMLVTHLAADPEFDPLPWEADISDFVASRMTGTRPGLVALVQQQLNQYAYESGLIAKVEEELQREARMALRAMSPLDRDMYGFTSRNAKRLQLAEPYISHVKESRRRFVVYWMSRFEGEDLGLKREARYATAVRRLAAQGQTRASISRMLGVSTSVMDRIERENRKDVLLGPDDPILTDLAPSLQ